MMERNPARGYTRPYSARVTTQTFPQHGEVFRQPDLRRSPPASLKRNGRPGRLRTWLLAFTLLIALAVFTPLVVVQLINAYSDNRIFASVRETPARPVAIVFGAGLQRNGEPSWMLADRLNQAIELYRAGKVERILMTGDNVTSIEVDSMRQYAVRHGVPAGRILTDPAGLRTYDSCYRAAHNFNISRAVLVTQGYHLPRALYLCNSLGVESVGLKAGREDYPNQDFYNSREFMATFLSWVDITIIHPKPEITR